MPFKVKKLKGIRTDSLPDLGNSVIDLARYVEDEFSEVATALQGTEPDPIWYKVPPKPRRGTTVYADGVNWNPGSGEGPYFFNGSAWTAMKGGGGSGGGIPEAPSDSNTYGRVNATWAKVLPMSGGTLTGALVLQADPSVPLGAATKEYVDARSFPDAVANHSIYGRKDNTWVLATTLFLQDTPPATPVPIGSFWWRSTDGTLFVWYNDGTSTQWVAVNAAAAAGTFIGAIVAASAPSSANPGTLWWNSTNGQLYIYYNDGNSIQWVAIQVPSATMLAMEARIAELEARLVALGG